MLSDMLSRFDEGADVGEVVYAEARDSQCSEMGLKSIGFIETRVTARAERFGNRAMSRTWTNGTSNAGNRDNRI